MIETTIDEVDGVQFLKDIRILEPDDTVGGMGVYRIDDKTAVWNPEVMRAIKVLGLRRVGRQVEWRANLYAQFPIPFLPIKLVQFALRVYWATIRFLYDNARVFKQIPPNQCFSWTYFTPYVWFRKLKGDKNAS